MNHFKKKLTKLLSGVLAVALILGLSGISGLDAEAKSKKNNTVILYFSATGTTKRTARKIKKSTGGKLVEIKAADPYTDADLDYYDNDSRVVKEHESAASPAKSSVRPKIKNMKAIKNAVKNAKTIYIGYPIWWGEAPHIVYTLVENVNLKGKTVIPFCTSVSSGLGSSAKHLKNRARAKSRINTKTKWRKGRNFYDVPSQKTINRWVKSL